MHTVRLSPNSIVPGAKLEIIQVLFLRSFIGLAVVGVIFTVIGLITGKNTKK